MTNNAADPYTRRTIVAAGVLGATGVALGAFGAHGLKSALADVADGALRLEWWDKATRYQMWHALLVGLLASSAGHSRTARFGVLFSTLGVVLFSGSLYAMTLTGVRWLGAITPLGGVSFIAAWSCFALSGRARSSPTSTSS